MIKWGGMVVSRGLRTSLEAIPLGKVSYSPTPHKDICFLDYFSIRFQHNVSSNLIQLLCPGSEMTGQFAWSQHIQLQVTIMKKSIHQEFYIFMVVFNYFELITNQIQYNRA